MRILSIDIGIKHLAFCLFNCDDKKDYKIEKWNVINLCKDKLYTCVGTNTKKKPCTRTPRYTKNNSYYCKIHAKHNTLKIPPKEYKEAYLCKAKIAELKKICVTLGLPCDRKMKKADYLNSIRHYIDHNYLDPIPCLKAKDFNIVTLGRNMQSKFNELLNNIVLDRVIIENQIGPLANRMKMLQGMVMQHFIETNVEIIEEISAANKLKFFLKKGQKTTYNERKKLSIDIMGKNLEANPNISEWHEFFLRHKKKDDLADSFLQGLWYLRFHNLIK